MLQLIANSENTIGRNELDLRVTGSEANKIDEGRDVHDLHFILL